MGRLDVHLQSLMAKFLVGLVLPEVSALWPTVKAPEEIFGPQVLLPKAVSLLFVTLGCVCH